MADEGGLRLAFAPIARCVDFGPRTAPVRDMLAALVSGWDMRPATGAAHAFAQVEERAGRYRLSSPWLDAPCISADPLVVAGHLAVDLSEEWQADRPAALSLHCAALVIDGRLVLLPGTARSGKSLFAAAAALAGHRLLGDDVLALAGEGDRLGFSMGLAPRLRLPLPDTVGPALRDFVTRHKGPADARYAYLSLADDLAPHYGSTAPIGAVVLLDRRSTGAAELIPSPRGSPLERLLLARLSDEDDRETLQRLTPLLSALPCYRLAYCDPQEGVAALATIDWAPPLIQPAARPKSRLANATCDRRFRARPDVLVETIDGDAFLAAHGGAAVRLNAVSLGVWNLLAQPTAVAEAVEIVTGAFPDEPADRIAADIRRLFEDLCAHRLIEIA